jgi:DnaK suppressor protein
MNLKHLEPRLRVKEHELLSTMAALGAEARESGEIEVRDHTDDATSSQGTSESLEAATILAATLEEVRDALNRLKHATYGKCTICGREIERSRLAAIPWTPYCLEDQEKQDLKMHPESSVRWQSA